MPNRWNKSHDFAPTSLSRDISLCSACSILSLGNYGFPVVNCAGLGVLCNFVAIFALRSLLVCESNKEKITNFSDRYQRCRKIDALTAVV